MSLIDQVIAFASVLATNIDPRTQSIQAGLTGIGSVDEEDGENEKGEVAPNSEVYGALGLFARPTDPEIFQGKDYGAETVAIRTADGLVPIAWRDLRLMQAFPAEFPKGRVALVGYGGGFHSLDLTDDGNTIHVIYCPYDRDGSGAAQKAHAVILDPTPGNEAVTIAHGEGYLLAITAAEGFQFRCPSPDGDSTFVNVKPREITLAADKINLKGNVLVGAALAGHVPMLAGAASPPCPGLWLSPSG